MKTAVSYRGSYPTPPLSLSVSRQSLLTATASYALKYIRRACPGVVWVQSFADERCKGLGVVYQACSFLYLGAHVSPFYVLDGEVYHKLNATARGRGGRAAYLRANIDRAQMVQWRQFRYLRFLKTDWRRRLRLPVLPYPKPWD